MRYYLDSTKQPTEINNIMYEADVIRCKIKERYHFTPSNQVETITQLQKLFRADVGLTLDVAIDFMDRVTLSTHIIRLQKEYGFKLKILAGVNKELTKA